MASPVRPSVPQFKGATFDKDKAQTEAIDGDIETFKLQGTDVYVYNGPKWDERDADTYRRYASHLAPLKIAEDGTENGTVDLSYDSSHKDNKEGARRAHYTLNTVKNIFFSQASGVPVKSLWNSLLTDLANERHRRPAQPPQWSQGPDAQGGYDL
jgi:hypothetical protein